MLSEFLPKRKVVWVCFLVFCVFFCFYIFFFYILQWKKPKSNTSARWSRSTATGINHADSMYSSHQAIQIALYLCGLPSQTSLIIRKILDKPQLRGTLQNAWSVLFKTLKVIKNKKSDKLSQPKRAKAMWQLTVIGILDRILEQDKDNKNILRRGE